MTWPRLPRSNTQRQGVVRSSMTPGAGGGRSAVVAPTPAAPPPMKTVEPGYVPLDPWGVEGDATYRSAPWYGVFEDAAAAAAGTGPSMQFGVHATGGGIVFLTAAEDETRAYVGMELGSTTSSFVQIDNLRIEMSGNSGGGGFAAVSDRGDAAVAMTVDSGTFAHDVAELDVHGHPSNSSFRVWAEDHASPGTWGTTYLDMTRCETDPSAPSAGSGRFFLRDNGSGKVQFCARFPSGAVQVIATEP